MNVTVSRFFQRTPPLEKKESRDDDGNDERFITTTKTQFCDEFSSAHARRVSEMMRVGVFFSPEKRLMMRETKERERERKREKVRQNGKIKKPKNPKIPSSAAFSSSAFSPELLIFAREYLCVQYTIWHLRQVTIGILQLGITTF